MTKEDVMSEYIEKAYREMMKEYEKTKSKESLEALYYLGRFIEYLRTDENYSEVVRWYKEGEEI